MGQRLKIIKEWVDVVIAAPNQTYKESFEVDKHAAKIIGVLITSSNDALTYYRGSQRITFNEKEIYPEGFESKLLMQGLNVPAKERLIPLGEELEPGNRKAEIEFKDEDHPAALFSPYKVRLYVFSRIDEE